MSERTRRRRSAEEKLRIVPLGLDGTIEIGELCRWEGINPTQYYGWKKQLLSAAGKIVDNGPGKSSAKEVTSSAVLSRAKDVIAASRRRPSDRTRLGPPTCGTWRWDLGITT